MFCYCRIKMILNFQHYQRLFLCWVLQQARRCCCWWSVQNWLLTRSLWYLLKYVFINSRYSHVHNIRIWSTRGPQHSWDKTLMIMVMTGPWPLINEACKSCRFHCSPWTLWIMFRNGITIRCITLYLHPFKWNYLCLKDSLFGCLLRRGQMLLITIFSQILECINVFFSLLL